MSEEKHFAASAARLAKAKRDGDLPRSQDLCAVASLASASLATFASLDALAGGARTALAQAFRADTFSPWPYVTIASCVLTVYVSALAGAVVTTYLQTGAFAFVFPAPKLEKLDAFAGFKRMLSRDAAFGALKALFVATAVTAAVVPAIGDAFSASGAATPAQLGATVVRAVIGIVATALGIAALFAIGDAFLERAKWRRRLRMSFDELKRDHKQSEGDPLLRGRRKQAHRALVRGSLARVKDAAFIVTNPTHVAIALEYRPPEIAVPRVLVRAVDEGAREVKRRARTLNLPIVENVSLARSLLATCDVGDVIPPDAYGAVAAIVAMLLRTKALAP